MPHCKQTQDKLNRQLAPVLCVERDHSERWCHKHEEDDESHCPDCGEEIILMPPDSIGECQNCHHRTEEGR